MSIDKPDFYESEIRRNTDYVEDSSFRTSHAERKARKKKAADAKRRSLMWFWFALLCFAIACLARVIWVLLR